MSSSAPKDSHSSQGEGDVCHACGFEASFVEDGMIQCERCHKVSYCSVHCLQWDWKSGGHAETCVDVRPPEPSESEAPESESGAADDLTLVSMDLERIFGSSKDSKDLQTSDHSPKRKPPSSPSNPSNGKGQNGNVSPSVKDRQTFWENKMKTAESPPGPTTAPTRSPEKSPTKLGAFFESESRKTPPATPKNMATTQLPPTLTPELQQEEEVVEEELEESYEFEYDEESCTSQGEDTSVMLQSIVEESSFSEEPVEEGSWRGRDHFQVKNAASSAKEESHNSEELEIVHEEAVEDSIEAEETPEDAQGSKEKISGSAEDNGKTLTENRNTPQLPEKRKKPATTTSGNTDHSECDSLATDPAPSDSQSDLNTAAANLKDFRAAYASDEPHTNDKTPRRSSLKMFREVYTSGSTAASKRSVLSADTTQTEGLTAVSPQRRESLKKSINTALRDIEVMYGEEAANTAYLQLTGSLVQDKGYGKRRCPEGRIHGSAY